MLVGCVIKGNFIVVNRCDFPSLPEGASLFLPTYSVLRGGGAGFVG